MKNIFICLYKAKRIINIKFNRYLWKKNVEGMAALGDGSYMDRPYIITGAKYMTIGKDFHCGMGSRIQCIDEYEGVKYSPKIIIGDGVSINMNAEISAINQIVLEDGVQLASNVLIVDHFHGDTEDLKRYEGLSPTRRELYSKGSVRICKNVWIGYGVAIMPGVTIGEGSIIGANAVITKDVDPFSIIGGVPGRKIC